MKFKFILILLLIGFSHLASACKEPKVVVKEEVKAVTAVAAVKTPDPKTTTTGFMQEITEVRVHNGPDRTGKEIYDFRCNGCHGRNTQGAPMPDDGFEWTMRLQKKGMDVLLRHAMDGYKQTLMPPKGGCRDCNENEVYAAVYYMLERSGTKFTKAK